MLGCLVRRLMHVSLLHQMRTLSSFFPKFLKNSACRPPHLSLYHTAAKAGFTRGAYKEIKLSNEGRAEHPQGIDVLANAIIVTLGPKGDLRKDCAQEW